MKNKINLASFEFDLKYIIFIIIELDLKWNNFSLESIILFFWDHNTILFLFLNQEEKE